MFLTKSDFKVARTCPTKLYYKKLRYPSRLDDDPYLDFLADGGYMVETMAKLLYPQGREIGNWSNPEKAFQETCRALEADPATLFEATIIHDNLLARVDILQRKNTELHLIEVKSSSIDSDDSDIPDPFRGKKGGISSKWRPYLEDVTFQVVVLRRAFPKFKIIPFLCVVDKAKIATENVTIDKFQLRRITNGWRPDVTYSGDAGRIQNENLLARLNISYEVEELAKEIETAADDLALTLRSDPIQRNQPEIGKKCKNCEYRLLDRNIAQNGFRECWGKLADPDPHILHLYRVDLAGGQKNDLVSDLAVKGQTALHDIPVELLTGETAIRQNLQLEYTAAGREYIAPDLPQILSRHPYPLHFIDFECSRIAIPYHVGMRPYEQAAYQWSCHTIRSPGGPIEHTEWLNDQEPFPNFEFARTLKNQIGDIGTVYIWSSYEKTALRDVREQMDKYGEKDEGLKQWLDRIIVEGNQRVVDLCKLAEKYYFHPQMRDRLSIKYVLPAVWGADEKIRSEPLFQKYEKRDDHGQLLNPYATLPPLPIGAKEEVVKEGTGAMRTYQEMMFGLARTDANLRQQYRQLLLQYCKLDTAAMVIIWLHWLWGGTERMKAER